MPCVVSVAASRRTQGLRKIRLSRLHSVAYGAAFAVAVAVTPREGSATGVWLYCTGTKLTTSSYGSRGPAKFDLGR